jgi:predicted Zn-dependent protease
MTKSSQRHHVSSERVGLRHSAVEDALARQAPVWSAVLGTLFLSSGVLAQPAPPAAGLPDVAPAASAPATLGGPAAGLPSGAEGRAGPSTAPAEQSAALATLKEQVEYWRAQNRPELAKPAVERLLAAHPRDPEVLAIAADVAGQLGRTQEVEGYLATLRSVAPADPHIARIERQRNFGEADRAMLEEARNLAQSGRTADALARYRTLFPNEADIPDNILPEFYSALAATSLTGFRQAIVSLEAAIQRTPDNVRLELTLARIQTYRETTRFTGIESLARLAKNPAVAPAARAAWRQALLWSGANGETLAAIQAYLNSNPSDPQIEAKLQEAQGSLPDEGSQARIAAYEALMQNQNTEAERGFQVSIAANPNDAGAIVGLGILRMRQNRLAEARELRDRAIALAPDRTEEFSRAFSSLDRSAPGAGGGRGSAQAPSPSVQARRALTRGNLDLADRYARLAATSNANERVQAEVILGQVALRRDDLTTAETRFRAALARRPRLPEAIGGLYEVLQRQNRFAEADALQQETGFQAPPGSAAQRAYALRDQASRLEDPVQAMALLEQARTTDPSNPWIRLDIARLLRAQGQDAEADREEQDLAGLGAPDAAYAAALLATEQERYEDVIQRLEAVPNRVRNTDMTRLLARGRQLQDIARLEQMARQLPRSNARAQLLALAGRPDPSGATGAGVVRAFGRLQDSEGAGQAAHAAWVANPNATVDAQIQLASALLSARRVEDADAISTSLLVNGNVTAEQRREIASLTAGSAIIQSGRLSAEGEQDAALAQLQPSLEELPDNVPLNMALARVYLASGRPADAQRIADAVLERRPGNLEALTVAADAALARRDWNRAEILLQEGRSRYPMDPQIMLLDSRMARARGDNYRALRSLESAGVRRYTQLQANGTGGSTSDAALLAASLRGHDAVANNGNEINDPVAAQIARELVDARKETETWIQAGVGIRHRTGEPGLSRFTEVTAPVEFSTPLPNVGGRVTARAETVVLNSGSLSRDLYGMRAFGSNSLAGTSTAGMARPSSSATGVALNVGYAYGDVRADVGSTPLGFRTGTVVGGAEYAPLLTGNLRLRMTAERRSVTNSILSYAGLRDDRTGSTWGGVVQTGGRAQLEYQVGNVVLYGGPGYASLDGHNVAGNTRFDVGGGVAWTALRRRGEDLILGIDSRYMAYDRNLSAFSLGQGGYFSPQSYFATVLQADWRKQLGDWRLRLAGGIGWQTYREDDSPVFANDAGRQAQLVSAAAADPSLNTTYKGQSNSGVVGNLRAEIEYPVTPQLRLGAAASYERSGDWDQTVGLIRLRYAFEQPGPDLPGSVTP